ncbi:MAG: hypothetical protein ACE5J5_00735 [Candidatus Hydrothermarchaeales archaeon]
MFDKRVYNTSFISPLKDFQLDTQPIEYRRDTLLNRWCRINIERTKRVKQGQDLLDISDLVKRSKDRCFFCPENIARTTPKFPKDIAPEGRIKVGETYIFPNLFPFAQHHAIATISEEHYLALEEFKVKQIEDTIKASLDYFERVNKAYDNARCATFNWNYLPPSGASIVHPHAQLTVDPDPPFLTKAYLDASDDYQKKKGENFWLKLVNEEEKANERFIARTGSIAWFTSFVPLGNNEVNAVFTVAQSLADLSDKDISDLSKGIKNVLTAYSSLSVQSFNITSYSTPLGEERESFRLNFKFISRPSPSTYYTSDTGFMEILHRERIVESMPEDVAKTMKTFFN